jgi:integrase
VRGARYSSHGYASSREIQQHSGLAVQEVSRRERLEAGPSDLRPPSVNLASELRPLRGSLEQAVDSLRIVEPAARGSGNERIFPELGLNLRLPVSALLADNEVLSQAEEGIGRGDIGLPLLAEPDLFSGLTGIGDRHTADSVSSTEPVDGGERRTTSSDGSAHTDRLEIIRQRYAKSGISEKVIRVLLESNRETTSATYQTAWNTWVDWNFRRGADPLRNDLTTLLEYLVDLRESGKAYSTINVHRSMLSVTLEKINNIEVGKHPWVTRLIAGLFNKAPLKPRYPQTWNPDVVIQLAAESKPNEDLGLAELSYKTVTILALATMLRTAELASINKQSIQISEPSITFLLSRPRKPKKRGPLHSFTLRRLDNDRVCPVSCLSSYIARTQNIRPQANRGSVFISLKKPHSPVSSTTIGVWIKKYLATAGIDTTVFGAHSTRSAAASKAAVLGLPTDAILRAAHWTNESTFNRFYRKDFPLDVSATVLTRQSLDDQRLGY